MHVCGDFHLQDSRRRLFTSLPQTYGFRLLRFTLRFQPPHLFFRPFCHGSSRSVRRGLFHVFHPRRLRAHSLHITCHGRRAPFNGHGVWKTRPMSYRFDFFSLPTPSSPRRSFHSTFRSFYSAIYSSRAPGQPEVLVFRLTAPFPASVPDSAFPAPPILSVVYPTSPNWRCTPRFSSCLKIWKSFLASLIPCLFGNLHDANTCFFRRFQLFFQFTEAHFQIFTVLQIF